MELPGRVALITGGRRIGAVVAAELAAHGVDVALSYHRSRDEAARAAETVRERGRRAVALAADLARPAECARLVADTVAALGRIDILIHMASVYRQTAFEQVGEVDWDAGLAVDLRAGFFCAQAAVPHMRAAGGGRLIFFSDWLAASGRPRYRAFVPYYVAKVGVIALTQALALELAADGILVNAVAPGPILPPPEAGPAEVEAVARATPLGRWGGAQEIAKAVVALLASDFITGEVVRVDGGRHIR